MTFKMINNLLLFLFIMKRVYYVLAALSLVAVCSCQQEEISSSGSTSIEDSAREIGFVSMDAFNKGTRSFDDSGRTDDGMDLGLIARIARPKTGCISGFGLCDFHVLDPSLPANSMKKRSAGKDFNKYECTTTCRIDSTGHGHVRFLLADKPETQGLTNETMPCFYVDEEIGEPVDELYQDSLIIQGGAYEFDKTLGSYGGYEVNLQYKKHE